MIHNFNKPRHIVIPNRIPKYYIGDTVRIVSNQHILYGESGEITAVYPAQSNVFYRVKTACCGNPSIPERMLAVITPNQKEK